MASIWTGAISFGVLNIPVKLEAAVRSHDLSFKLLYEEKKGKVCPVKYRRVCEHNGKEVPWGEIRKGYAYGSDQYVVLQEEDFEKAALATSKAFEIQAFTGEADVDPRYFEKPYYVLPQKGGEHPYAVLREAMSNAGAIGIGTITLRKKQYLAAIKVIDEAIVLDLMRFADEVVDADEFRFPSGEGVKPAEIRMAEQVVKMLWDDFEPERYRDEYKANLEKIIQARMKGKHVKLSEPDEPEVEGVIDLMARLKETLEKGGAKKPAKKSRKATAGTKKRKSA
jgi:DNA end-binding protein Ku